MVSLPVYSNIVAQANCEEAEFWVDDCSTLEAAGKSKLPPEQLVQNW